VRPKFTEEKKESVKASIVPKALDLFYQKGIPGVAMMDIAEKCSIGIATLYRYFKEKKAIVIPSGTLLWNRKKEEFEKIYGQGIKSGKDGYGILKNLYSYFLELFEKEPEFFRFLADFDAFLLREKPEEQEMDAYDSVLGEIKDVFHKAVTRGQEDGSVRKDIDFGPTYYSFSKALLGLGEKLSMKKDLLKSDREADKEKQMETMLKAVLEYLKGTLIGA
jgi:AcrR family transcriptional regulator